ncbi:MAG: gliding motility-associated C-terminal domain-containing protein [Crocinitomicaceae bacterium]|nr:gliding motility-associated C-terminal domain-containing protein [Crocinitomicaceae bacterium]
MQFDNQLKTFFDTDTSYSSLNVYEDLILYVPNTFTPDDDEFNQYFTPVLASGYNSYTYEFLIFNRWGELIFETDIIGLGWDGKYNDNAVKDGTYIWKIRVSNKYDAERHEFVGHVNVLR